MFTKILLATDGSDHSIRAAEKAVDIAKCSPGSKVEVIYVVDGETSKSEVLRNWNAIAVTDSRKEKLKTTEEKAKKAGIQYEIKILHGEPGPTIVQHANEHDFDLVIVGSRGRNALQEFVLGSVSHKVAKRANCPVMIVK